MIVSWDTSAVVKLHRAEPGHDLAARRWHSEVLAVAATLCGADAVQLATALDVTERGVEVVLATWDRPLHAAALRVGLGVAPAEL